MVHWCRLLFCMVRAMSILCDHCGQSSVPLVRSGKAMRYCRVCGQRFCRERLSEGLEMLLLLMEDGERIRKMERAGTS